MFSPGITIDSDKFGDMSKDARLLYFYLMLCADDDGFIANPKTVMRMGGFTEDDLKILVSKKFVIPFKSGVLVIRHWRIHNSIRSDRYTETLYQEEKAQLAEINGTYMLIDIEVNRETIPDFTAPDSGNQLATSGIQSVSTGKERTGKDRSDSFLSSSSFSSEKRDIKDNENQKNENNSTQIPTLEQVREYCNEKNYHVNPERFLRVNDDRNWRYRDGSTFSWKDCLDHWETMEWNKDRKFPVQQKQDFQDFPEPEKRSGKTMKEILLERVKRSKYNG